MPEDTSGGSSSRHPALVNLSRDHHKALTAAQRLIKGRLGGEEEEVSVEERARDFLEFWAGHGQAHFREEEEVLLAVYSRHQPPCDHPEIRTMLNDHAWFRDMIPRLEKLLEAGGPLEDILPEIGERLKKHAKREEKVIFPHIQETLSEEDLKDIRERSDTFREQFEPAEDRQRVVEE